MNKKKELEQIAQAIEKCAQCKKGTIGKPVPGEGGAKAKVMFVGEAPGKNEAETGRPFVGRAGSVLDNLIGIAGLRREDVFITSAMKYLPKSGKPNKKQIKHGRPYLFKQIEVVKPKLIVLLGRYAVESVLNFVPKMSEEHGKIVEKAGQKYFITYHPASVLYSNATKDKIKKDFKKISKLL